MLKSIALSIALVFGSATIAHAETTVGTKIDITSKKYDPTREQLFRIQNYVIPGNITVMVTYEDVGKHSIEPLAIDLTNVREATDVQADAETRFGIMTMAQFFAVDVLTGIYAVMPNELIVGDTYVGKLDMVGEDIITFTTVQFKRNGVRHYARIVYFNTKEEGGWFVVYPVTE